MCLSLPLPLHGLRHRTRETLPNPMHCGCSVFMYIHRLAYMSYMYHVKMHAWLRSLPHLSQKLKRTSMPFALSCYLFEKWGDTEIDVVGWWTSTHLPPVHSINVQSTKDNNKTLELFWSLVLWEVVVAEYLPIRSRAETVMCWCNTIQPSAAPRPHHQRSSVVASIEKIIILFWTHVGTFQLNIE